MARLAGRRVLITGAAGAIGREMVSLFTAERAAIAARDLATPERREARPSGTKHPTSSTGKKAS